MDIAGYAAVVGARCYHGCVISAQYLASNNSIFINTSQIGVGFVDTFLGYNTIEIRYYKP